MKTFIINRKRWGKYALLNRDGKMCCLGFCSKSFGIPKEALDNISIPLGIENSKYKKLLPRWLLNSTSPGAEPSDVERLTGINDGDKPSSEKEELISKIFKKHHIIVKFVG